jgi:hypothetical protein
MLYETTSWQPCWCPTASSGGHRTYPCRSCGERTFETPCQDVARNPEYGAR